MGMLNHIQYEGSESYPSKILVPDGYFLNNSIPFNYRLYTPLLNGYVEHIFSRIYLSNRIYNTEEKKIAINSSLSNILTAHYNGKCLSISKNRNTYTIGNMYGMEHYTYTNIIPFISWLVQSKKMNEAPGFYDIEKECGRNTRVWATEDFIEEIESFVLGELTNSTNENLTHQIKYNCPIILKDGNKKPCNFRPTEETRRMKKFLDEYNLFMRSQDVSVPFEVNLDFEQQKKSRFHISDLLRQTFEYSYQRYIPDSYYNVHIPYNIHILTHTHPTITPLLRYNDTNYLLYKELSTELIRVFNTSFNLGGRFYGEFQGFPKEIRKQIMIDNMNTIEMDYSSLHFTMLYHLSGIDYQSDPYLAVIDNDELRPLLKLFCNILINAGSKRRAVGGFNEEIYRKDPKRKQGKRKFHREIIEKYNLSFEQLYNLFTDAHKPLENYFLSGVGLRLQNIDSHIAQNVMSHFLRKGIPCLCVHDSFIVPEKYRNELEGVMKETYTSKFNYNIKVK